MQTQGQKLPMAKYGHNETTAY